MGGVRNGQFLDPDDDDLEEDIDPRDYDDGEEIHEDVWCADCCEQTNTTWQDFGIGPYEYWGSKGVDVQLVEVTECCECPTWFEDHSELIAWLRDQKVEAEEVAKMVKVCLNQVWHALMHADVDQALEHIKTTSQDIKNRDQADGG